MKSRSWILFVVLLLLSPAFAFAGGDFGEQAPDFPPGVFSDGGHYTLADFKGKLLVIFFFESECPTCKGLVPKWNEMVAQYKDKPVKFLAVGPHNSLAGVKQYVAETHLAMPVFADNLDIMETMYGQNISLQNVRQFRLIDGNGKVVGYEMSPPELDKALEKISWKYKDHGYDPHLSNIIELLEWNQYEPALNQLRPWRKNSNKQVAGSAEKLYQAVKSEAEGWEKRAAKIAAKKPVEAFDLYSKIATLFAGDDLAKSVAGPLKALQADKTVIAEMSARRQYAQLYSAVPRAQFQQREVVANFCQSIVNQYPDTPTADRARALSGAILTASTPNN
jgi:thiol-disulfide isomerase/thioredoxin